MSNIYIQEPPTFGKVLLVTTVGDIDIELWSKEAPKACRNFIQLCLEGYYVDTLFHRVVKDFIVQGGDPTGTGTGGESVYGKPFKDEFHTRLRFVRRGLVAMANAGPNDNSSQFFFTMGSTPELMNKHTIFGKVSGKTVYNMLKLQEVEVGADERPTFDIKINKIEVLSNPFDDIIPRVVKKAKVTKEDKKKFQSKATKNYSLLSFGEEAEEDDEEVNQANMDMKIKSMSSHDLLINDHRLSCMSYGTKSSKRKLDDGDIDGQSLPEDDFQLEKDKDTLDSEVAERINKKLKKENESGDVDNPRIRVTKWDIAPSEENEETQQESSPTEESKDAKPSTGDDSEMISESEQDGGKSPEVNKELAGKSVSKSSACSDSVVVDTVAKEAVAKEAVAKEAIAKEAVAKDSHISDKLVPNEVKDSRHRSRSPAREKVHHSDSSMKEGKEEKKPDEKKQDGSKVKLKQSMTESSKDKEKLNEKEKKKQRKEDLRKEIEQLKQELVAKKQSIEQRSKKVEEKSSDTHESNDLKVSLEKEKSKYKQMQKEIGKKGASREELTLKLLAKFETKLHSAQKISQQYSDGLEKSEGEEESDGDEDDSSWMCHQLTFEPSGGKVLDANIPDSERYEIYDPRNPLNQRRREKSEKVLKGKH